ncbi:hypothetical protein B0H17DRAFT_1110458, partial [Mycena rosella]
PRRRRILHNGEASLLTPLRNSLEDTCIRHPAHRRLLVLPVDDDRPRARRGSTAFSRRKSV